MATGTVSSDPPQVVVEGNRLFLHVPYKDVDKIHHQLEKLGFPSSIHLDPAAREASLELRPGVQSDQLTAALGRLDSGSRSRPL